MPNVKKTPADDKRAGGCQNPTIDQLAMIEWGKKNLPGDRLSTIPERLQALEKCWCPEEA